MLGVDGSGHPQLTLSVWVGGMPFPPGPYLPPATHPPKVGVLRGSGPAKIGATGRLAPGERNTIMSARGKTFTGWDYLAIVSGALVVLVLFGLLCVGAVYALPLLWVSLASLGWWCPWVVAAFVAGLLGLLVAYVGSELGADE